MQAAIDALLAGHEGVMAPFDQRYRRRDQSFIWTIVKVSLARDAAGHPKHLIVVIEDISARKRMEQALCESERFVRSTMDGLSHHLCVVDEHGAILAVNKAWRNFGEANGGKPAISWENENYLFVCDRAAMRKVEEARAFAEGMRDVLFGRREEFNLEYECSSPDEQRWFLARVTRFPQDGPLRVVVSHENVTHAKLAQKHLTYLAHFDNLTSLPNRVLFYDRLKKTLLQAKRSKWSVAVMFIDLDHFKIVNDTMGHAVGDSLLKQAVRRIVNCLRRSDTVGRLGGDEFGVFLPDLRSAQCASGIARKIMATLAEPFHIDGIETFITPSIGIALYPLDSLDADTLVSNADTAMYRAKELGRSNYQSIKIDKSFVNGIGKGSDEGVIAATVITLGHSLKLTVIAEGVETEAQLETLKMLGCDMMQGFLFSRPLPADKIMALLKEHQGG
ncbi:MAG: diguanylate cyclase [Pseudomonadota bacterium]